MFEHQEQHRLQLIFSDGWGTVHALLTINFQITNYKNKPEQILHTKIPQRPKNPSPQKH